jgi:hypothetical protein
MHNHYIPQYYLKGFSNSTSSDNIWVYEKGSTLVANRPIKQVANENHRWPDKTEIYLANQIESPANTVLDKIRSRQSITPQDKDLLSSYIVVMWKRVDQGLKRQKTIAPKIFEDIFNHLHDRILELMKEHPTKISLLENRLLELASLRSKYENEFPIDLWFDSINPETPLQLRLILNTMTWIFLTSDKVQQPFLTNDNPVFYFTDIGIGKPESEITFPISSTTTLWATWRIDLNEGYLSAKENAIKQINRRTIKNTTRYVYYSQNVDWALTLINKKPSSIILSRMI